MQPVITPFHGTTSEEQKELLGNSTTPDCNGAAGRAHFVEFINGAFAIYDKATGTLVGDRVSDAAFWEKAGLQFSGPLVDPRIVFMPDAGLNGQWLAVQLLNMGQGVFVATTNPNDPNADPRLGNWKASQFPLPGADFPMLGYDANGVYIGSNTEAGSGRRPQLVCIPRANALAYPPRVGPGNIKIIGPLQSARARPWFNHLYPVIDLSGAGWDSATTLAVNDFDGQYLMFALISSQFEEILSRGEIVAPPFTPVSEGYRVKQPFGDRVSNVLYSNPGISSAPMGDGFNIWLAHTVLKPDPQPDGSLAVRWYRLAIDPVTRQPGMAAWGEIAQAGYDCFNPSIVSFGKDDYTVVAFSRSGNPSTAFPPYDPRCGNIGAYLAVVRESDPANPRVFTVQSGQANNYIPAQAQRWGDYSTLCLDPAHPRRAWLINQYVLAGGTGTSQWGNAIASVDVPR